MLKKGRGRESGRGKVVLVKARGGGDEEELGRDREDSGGDTGRADKQQDPKHSPGASSKAGEQCLQNRVSPPHTVPILGQLPAPFLSLWAAPSRGQMRLQHE